MSKIRIGNKKNSILNGEWAGHVRRVMKKITSSKRRMEDKRIINEYLKNKNDNLISVGYKL
jgi:hypothetical protein